MTEEDYKLMEVLIIERKPHRNGPQWKFAGKYGYKYDQFCYFVTYSYRRTKFLSFCMYENHHVNNM